MDAKSPTEKGQEWQNLPRGDLSQARALASKSVAKTEVSIMRKLYDDCVQQVALELLNDRERSKKVMQSYPEQAPSEVDRAEEREREVRAAFIRPDIRSRDQ